MYKTYKVPGITLDVIADDRSGDKINITKNAFKSTPRPSHPYSPRTKLYDKDRCRTCKGTGVIHVIDSDDEDEDCVIQCPCLW